MSKISLLFAPSHASHLSLFSNLSLPFISVLADFICFISPSSPLPFLSLMLIFAHTPLQKKANDLKDAIYVNKLSEETIKQYKSVINYQRGDGFFTPLLTAIYLIIRDPEWDENYIPKKIEIIKLLLRHGANPSMKLVVNTLCVKALYVCIHIFLYISI